MPTFMPLMLCATLCTASLAFQALPAVAATNAGFARAMSRADQGTAAVTPIQYRGRFDGRRIGYGRGYGGGYGGDGAAIGIGALIIGGIVLSEAARAEHRRTHGGDWQRCADTYRSFDSSSGLYTGYDGEQHSCPYLR